MKYQFQLLDELLTSWTGWDYKTFTRKTGWGDGLFNEATGYIRPKMAKLYSRPYAHAAAGTINHMKYDDETGYFTLNYTVPANTSSNVLTEIVLNPNWHYPRGFHIMVNPVSYNKYWFDKNQKLYVSTQTKPFGQTVLVTVKSK